MRANIYFPLAIIVIAVVALLKSTDSRLPLPYDNCPEWCMCDEIYLHVNCTSSNLTSLQPINNNTRSLILDRNQLSVITKNFFWGMTNLRYLSLVDNIIDEIKPTSFQNQRKLVTLDLSGNLFGEVPSAALQHLRVLKELDLHDNQIRTLSKEPWYNLSRLEILHLDSNSILNIPMVMTSQLKRVIEFTISNNNISAIPSYQFINCTNLLRLDLSYNQITFKSKSTVTNMPYYTYNDHSSEVPTVATEEEYLADDTAEGITVDSLKGLTKLKDLDLSVNQITHLEYGIFNDLTALEILAIDNNKLTFIEDDVFLNQYNLLVLSLSGNKLKCLSSIMFENLRSLEVLQLSNNRIVDILPLTSIHMFNLRELHLKDNSIKEVPAPGFAEHPNLERLYLQKNHLRYIPDVRNLSRLSVLNLNRNNIREISPVNAFEGTAITELHLSNNKLKSLDYGIIYSIKSTLMRLTVKGNNYVCDCKLTWIVNNALEFDFLYDQMLGKYLDSLIICESPPMLAEMALYDGVGEDVGKLKCTEYADPHRILLLVTSWSGVVAFSLVLFWVYTYFDFKQRFYFKTSRKRYRLVHTHASDENDNVSLTGRNSKVRFRSFDSDTEGFVYDEETTV